MINHSESVDPTLTLSIVQLDHSISHINHPVAEAATRVLDHLSCSTPSDAPSTSTSNSCPTLREKVEKSIMRYRRDPDRWTSLTSLLLKSLAFYRSVDPAIGISPTAEKSDDPSTGMEKLEINEKKLSIVDLPRTKYNRPYLPQSDGGSSPSKADKEEEVNENCNSMMNVSHQYPWVCMAQQQLHSTVDTSKSSLLGVDLVIFSARISKYTPTIEEFLKAFVKSYTPWEWERIKNRQCPSWYGGRKMSTRPRSDQSKLREFFLRWSVKEAYTKALGLGMHINFDEFETRLDGVDVDAGGNEEDEGIWTSIMKQEASKGGNSQRQFSVIGKVKRKESPTSWECWEFIFIPLGDGGVQGSSAQETMASQLSGADSCYNACACICRGPLAKNAPGSHAKNNPTAIELLTLVDLVQLHGSNPL